MLQQPRLLGRGRTQPVPGHATDRNDRHRHNRSTTAPHRSASPPALKDGASAAAEALQARADEALREGDTAAFRRLNDKIMQTERDLLTRVGLPGRPWYRHQIYAPGIDTGYATQRLPALNDALFVDPDLPAAKAYEARLYGGLRAATRTLTLTPEEQT